MNLSMSLMLQSYVAAYMRRYTRNCQMSFHGCPDLLPPLVGIPMLSSVSSIWVSFCASVISPPLAANISSYSCPICSGDIYKKMDLIDGSGDTRIAKDVHKSHAPSLVLADLAAFRVLQLHQFRSRPDIASI